MNTLQQQVTEQLSKINRWSPERRELIASSSSEAIDAFRALFGVEADRFRLTSYGNVPLAYSEDGSRAVRVHGKDVISVRLRPYEVQKVSREHARRFLRLVETLGERS